MSATLFLAVLIVALFLGNVFLSLTDPKRLKRAAGAEPALEQSFELRPEEMALAEPVSFEGNAAKEKMDYLNKRVDRLEQLLLKIDNSKFIAQKLNATNLYQKLNGLDEFKQNTRLEIAALKQRIDKVQPAPKAKKVKVPEISDENLKEIVFRASR